MRAELKKKIEQSVRLLKSIGEAHPNEVIELAYSGGKDSDVILQLAKEAGINYKAYYKNTTIDPPQTIKHAKEMGAEVVRPKKTFFELIKEHGLPSRFSRFCCGYLKEYKILDTCIVGIRQSESRKRAERYKEPTECKVYSKKDHVQMFYPILTWTDEDVAEFIQERGLKCHPLYYDENGEFHVERRLGCIGCPMQSRKKRVSQFAQYPKFLKQWLKSLKAYRDTHPNVKVVTDFDFRTEYDQMYYDLYCDSLAQYRDEIETLWGRVPTKEFLHSHFRMDL